MKYIVLSLLWIFALNALGQKKTLDCGITNPPDSVLEKSLWKGNNKYIVDLLGANGFTIPDDYFDRVDSKGLYKGKRLKLFDFEKNKNSSEGHFGALTLDGTRYYFPIKVWVHTDASGNSPLTFTQLNARINDAIQTFFDNNSPIVFYRLWNIAYVFNSPHNNIETEYEKSQMFSNYRMSNAINVHLAADGYVLGSAGSIGSTDCFFLGGSGQFTLAHELGHCMGLLHTHNAYPPCGGEDNEECADCWQEPVSRTMTQPFYCGVNVGETKCSVYGDQLCDTPGEPLLTGYINDDCSLDPLPNDNWGALWQPMRYNVMSGARATTRDCRTLFTVGQMGVMIAKKPFNPSTSAGYSIAGSATSCRTTTQTYSVPVLYEVSTYEWQVPSGVNIISGQGTNQITVGFSVSGNHKITVRPNCCFPMISKNVNVINSISIQGSPYVTTRATEPYSTTSISGATYSWTLPSGWSTVAGHGTAAIDARTSSVPSSGTVRVTMGNTSCNGTASLFVTVTDGGFSAANSSKTNTANKKIIVIDLNLSQAVMEFDSMEEYEQHMGLLPKGFYAIKIVDESMEIETSKVVKQ